MSPHNFDFSDTRMDYEQPNYTGTPPAIHRGYTKSPTGRNYYDKSPQYESSQYESSQTSRSPRGSRSLEYGAVSPKQQKKFEYYQPSSPDNDDEDSSYVDYQHSVIYYGKKKKKPYNKSPNGVSSLDDYNSSSAGYGQRNSIVTESSAGSDFSNATTARCGSSGTETEGRSSSRRRHAINITNNPAYQVSITIYYKLYISKVTNI